MSRQTSQNDQLDSEMSVSQPLERALSMLEAVVGSGGRLSAAGLADQLDLPLPSAARIARQLEQMGLLRRVAGTRRLMPGPRLSRLGCQTVRSSFEHDRPQALLATLARSLGEHCQIGVVIEYEVVYVASARASRPVALHFEPGTAAPIHCTSTGKLFLSSLGREALTQLLGALELTRHTGHTITEPARLIREVEAVRRRGWARNGEEFVAGVVGCSVPIYDADGALIAGLGISVPQSRMSLSALAGFVPEMQRSAAAIGAALTEDQAD